MRATVQHIITNRRVRGYAINEAIRDAEEIAIGELRKAPGTIAYGYTAYGLPHLADGDPAIIITVTYDREPADQCPTCGAVLVWGAGPSCPNECPDQEGGAR